MAGESVAKALAGNLVHVLLVDDEPSVVAGLRRHLHGRFVVHTATTPFEALQTVDANPQLGVVVSDMQMPGMNGAALLRHIKERSPMTVRVLLTGQADIDAAVDAINEGHIFRFLWKPCDVESLLTCLQDAATQHRLMTAERELQERTLRGSVRALLETLSMASPIAFARADRIKRRVLELATALDAESLWEIEIATMLAQLGTVSLPPAVIEKLHRGQPLTDVEQAEADGLPERAVSILAGIPRLEGVTRTIRLQRQRFDGRGPVAKNLAGADIPLGSRLLAVATAYDVLEARGTTVDIGVAALREDRGRYDPDVVAALEGLLLGGAGDREIAALAVDRLTLGMVLADDVMTRDGILLYGHGQELTERALDRLRNWPDVCEPVAVYR